MRPGDTLTLPGGRGSVTFEKVIRWAGISVREDPGKPVTFVAALTTVAALFAMLLVRRRRSSSGSACRQYAVPRGRSGGVTDVAAVTFVAVPPDGITVVRVGAIAKTADAALRRSSRACVTT